jgi:hypothetical protein
LYCYKQVQLDAWDPAKLGAVQVDPFESKRLYAIDPY